MTQNIGPYVCCGRGVDAPHSPECPWLINSATEAEFRAAMVEIAIAAQTKDIKILLGYLRAEGYVLCRRNSRGGYYPARPANAIARFLRKKNTPERMEYIEGGIERTLWGKSRLHVVRDDKSEQ